jgi:hypothetical protein
LAIDLDEFFELQFPFPTLDKYCRYFSRCFISEAIYKGNYTISLMHIKIRRAIEIG